MHWTTMQQPIKEEAAKILFALISIDASLPKKKRIRLNEVSEEPKEHAEAFDPLNPATKRAFDWV